jgi:hypothetical protein
MTSTYQPLPALNPTSPPVPDIFSGQPDERVDVQDVTPVPTDDGQVQSFLEDQRPKKQRKRTLSAIVTDGWTLEWASLIASITLLASLIVLLGVFHGRATSKWTAELSLTTIIAIIAKAVQITLMLPVAAAISQLGWIHFDESRPLIDFQRYDAASRGFTGSVQLLFSIPSRRTIFCAMLAILSLSIEAAAQQCLQTTAQEYIPALQHIFTLDSLGAPTGIATNGIISAGVLSVAAKGAMTVTQIAPIDRTRIVLPESLVYSCPAANCAIDPYVTINLCLTCEDVTEQLEWNPCLASDDGNLLSECGTGVSLPDGTALGTQDQALAMNATTIDPVDPGTFKPGPLVVANFSMVHRINQTFSFGTEGPVTDFEQPEEYAAQSCSVLICANAYQLDVSQGSSGSSGAVEHLIGSVTHAEYSETGASDGYSYRSAFTIPVTHGAALSTVEGQTVPWKGRSTSVDIDLDSMNFLIEYLSSLFTGSAMVAMPLYDFDLQSRLNAAHRAAQQPAGQAFWNGIVYALTAYSFKDVEDVYTQIFSVVSSATTSMGNWLRDFYPAGPHFAVPGSILGNAKESTYRIRWEWLAIPITAELLAMLLLIEVINATKHNKIPIWKSSTLATMLHGISRERNLAEPVPHTASAMVSAAEHRRVLLAVSPLDCHLIDLKDLPEPEKKVHVAPPVVYRPARRR